MPIPHQLAKGRREKGEGKTMGVVRIHPIGKGRERKKPRRKRSIHIIICERGGNRRPVSPTVGKKRQIDPYVPFSGRKEERKEMIISMCQRENEGFP